MTDEAEYDYAPDDDVIEYFEPFREHWWQFWRTRRPRDL